jgi:hypothetical protein
MSSDINPETLALITSMTSDVSELPPSQVRPANMTRQEWRRKQRASTPVLNQFTRTGKRKEPIPTIKLVNCPNCNKQRLGKYLADDGQPYPVSNEKQDVRGAERFLDVCGPCATKFRTEDTRFVMANLKKIQEAMRIRKDGPAGTTDKDFSIDL